MSVQYSTHTHVCLYVPPFQVIVNIHNYGVESNEVTTKPTTIACTHMYFQSIAMVYCPTSQAASLEIIHCLHLHTVLCLAWLEMWLHY